MEKLLIKQKEGGFSYEAQFNPTSYKQSYQSAYQKRQGINTSGAKANFLVTYPEQLNLTLILQEDFPNNGLNLFGLRKFGLSVRERVQKFLRVCYKMDGSKHEPHELELTWGKLKFTGVLTSANVNYTAFGSNGEPLRAELEVAFRGTTDDPLGTGKKSSPDLTHAISTKDWQTLPMACEDIYGDPHLYILLAEANGLNAFRRLKPGQKLYFPPTEKESPLLEP